MFKQRSYNKELLDEPVIAKEALYRNLKELEIINRYLGGHAVSLKGIQKVINTKREWYSVTDIGCGGGDSVKLIGNWAARNDYSVDIAGIDLKQDCIDYSRKNCAHLADIDFICNDFTRVFSGDKKPNVVHASLFFHHFKEADIISFLELCKKNEAIVIINDLERHPLAYYSIKYLTRVFSRSHLVKNDAPLSVLRGFKKEEWIDMLKKAGIRRYLVEKCWAFRHLIIAYPDGYND